MNVAVLPAPPRLFLVLALNIGMPFDRLTVSDLSRTRHHIDAEAFLQLGEDDAPLHLTLGAQQRLLRLRIVADDEDGSSSLSLARPFPSFPLRLSSPER